MKLSKMENKKLYLVTDYRINAIREQNEMYDIVTGNYLDAINVNIPLTTLQDIVISNIYFELKRRLTDNCIVISLHDDMNITNGSFLYANNILDTMAEILTKYCDPDTLIINIIPGQISVITDSSSSSKIKLMKTIERFEFLGFRDYDGHDYIYMNQAGLRYLNSKLRTMEYDYGK